MNLFGMGTWEIMIILVAALVIFGPDRLPEMAGKLGKSIRDLRQMSSDLTGEFERSAGVQELRKAVQGEVAGVKSQVTSVTDSVKRDLDKAGLKVSTSASTKATGSSSKVTGAKTAPTSSAKSTSGTEKTASTVVEVPKASKKDPLSDVSFLDELAARPAAPAKPAAATRSAAASTATNSIATANGTVNGSSPDQIDALSRARQRRMTAGYNRRPT
jgi:Tat protein translocase TatB subunit